MTRFVALKTILPELAATPTALTRFKCELLSAQQIVHKNVIRILVDTWMGRFDLGRAYVEAGGFTEADSEFDRCIRRRGEAISLFNDEATYGYFPIVYYYLGRAREGLKSQGFTESYRTYLSIREKAGEDPLLAEVRRRASS